MSVRTFVTFTSNKTLLCTWQSVSNVSSPKRCTWLFLGKLVTSYTLEHFIYSLSVYQFQFQFIHIHNSVSNYKIFKITLKITNKLLK